MKKNFLSAGLLLLAGMAVSSGVSGQTEDSSAYQRLMDNNNYSIRVENGKILEMTINGRNIPADSIAFYDPVVRKKMHEASKDRIQAEVDRTQAVRDKMQMEMDRLMAGRDKEAAELEALQLQKEDAAMRNQQQAMNEDRLKIKQELDRAMLQMEKAKQDMAAAKNNMVAIQGFLADVAEDGLVPDEKSILSLTLNKDEFILNGKKLPDAIHRKYAAKYLVKPGFSITYRK